MIKAICVCSLLILVAARPISPAEKSGSVDVQRLSKCIRDSTLADIFGSTSTSKAVVLQKAAEAKSTLSSDGSWPDIDYKNESRGAWPAGIHCERVLVMAAASTADPSFLEPAIHAMSWWQQHDLKCPNWWYNEIGIPERLGKAAIILRGKMPASEMEYIIHTVLPRSGKQEMTGTNKMWLNSNLLLLSLLTDDAAGALKHLDTDFDEAVVTTKEGIQPDFSFHQHGAQLQFGNYGLALFDRITQLAAAVKPANVKPSEPQIAALEGFGFDGLQWTIWHGTMDISSLGRQLFVDSAAGKGRAFLRDLDKVKVIDPSKKALCDSIVARNDPNGSNDLVGDRYFWRSDYLIHRSQQWMASVRMCSTRVLGCETINSENEAGYYLATGTTFFYRTGHEYDATLPLFDWHKIPGVTNAYKDGPVPKFKISENKCEFVGGVCDGTSSLATMDLDRDGVTAAKSYFCMGGQMICLGAAIHATSEDPIITTIDQCAADPKAAAGGGHRTSIDAGGFRYQTLDGTELQYLIGHRTGTWQAIYRNGAAPKDPVEGDVFTAWLDHGPHPSDASYAYAVSLESAKVEPAKVLSNTKALQAVSAAHVVAAIFREAGELPVGDGTIKVNSPCALLMDSEHHTITVSDPTEKLKTIEVTWNGKTKSIDLPAGEKAGSSVKVSI